MSETVPVILTVPNISVPGFKVLKDKGQTIKFYPTHLILECRGTCETEHRLTNQPEERDFHFVSEIPKYGKIELVMEDGEERFYVVYVDSWDFYFTDILKARQLFDVLIKWKYDNT